MTVILWRYAYWAVIELLGRRHEENSDGEVLHYRGVTCGVFRIEKTRTNVANFLYLLLTENSR